MEEMLANLSSRQISEWQAYENLTGPLDRSWGDDQLAEINELLQSLLHLTAQVNTKNGMSPETKPREVIRPRGLFDDLNRRIAGGEFN